MAFPSSWRHSKQLAQSFTGTSPKSLSTHMSEYARSSSSAGLLYPRLIREAPR
jgi:hypothetical protein